MRVKGILRRRLSGATKKVLCRLSTFVQTTEAGVTQLNRHQGFRPCKPEFALTFPDERNDDVRHKRGEAGLYHSEYVLLWGGRHFVFFVRGPSGGWVE